MTSCPDRRIPPAVQPVIACHAKQADEAWREHSALLLALRKAPSLANRPEFTALRMDAFERFSNAFWEA